MADYRHDFVTALSLLLIVLLVSACNLQTNPEEQVTPTEVVTTDVPPTIVGQVPTPITSGQATTIPLTIVTPSLFPTTASQVPININISAPENGQLVSGTVAITGSAVHPDFLQYQLQYATDPNPAGTWTLLGPVVQIPVENGLLGTWNTTSLVDGSYQLQLSVVLGDGSSLVAGVNRLQIQNRAPTAVPTATALTPRPLASFTQSTSSGFAPLNVTFANLSSGYINTFQWNFGDGITSNEFSPSHTYSAPGQYTVTLTVSGPGGQANISNMINVQGQAAPVAAFSADQFAGVTPLTVKFVNQSTGNFSNATWNFGDGTYADGNNPVHTFTGVGTYNVILTVSGAAGTSTSVHQVTVQSQSVPAPVAVFTFAPKRGRVPLTVNFTNQSTGSITQYIWNFGDGAVSTMPNPSHVFTQAGNYTVTLIAIGPGGQSVVKATVTVVLPPTATPVKPPPTVPPTRKPRPTPTLTPTPKPTRVRPTATPHPPTKTPKPPTATVVPLTSTPLPPTQAPPDLSDTQPVIPDLTDDTIQARLKAVFAAGVKAGNRANVFALVGDESAVDAGFLVPFANPQTYVIDKTTQPLEPIINWYSQMPVGGSNSWARRGVASHAGWTIHDLLDASKSDPAQCQPQETPLGCELRLTKASVVIVSVGANDVLQATDLEQFRLNLVAIIQTSAMKGVIPVLVTIPPRLDGRVTDAQIRAYNNMIIQVGNNRLVPVINSWRVINSLPNNGLNNDLVTLSVAGGGAGDLQADSLQFGMNRRNLSTLNSLNQIRMKIFPKAAPVPPT